MVDTAKTQKFVVDASTIVATLLIDEVFTKPAHKIIEYYRLNKIEIVAPVLLSYEVANAVRSACLNKRVSEKDSVKLIEAYKELKIPLFPPDEENIMITSIKTSLSIYESTYLSLAISSNILLISADKKFYNKLKNHSYKEHIIWIEDFKNVVKEKLN